MILKMIYRELKSSPKFFLIFVLNISIGLIGLSLIESFKGSFLQELNKNSKTILGADLALNSRIDISESKITKLSSFVKPTKVAKNISLFSMASAKDFTRLVSVKSLGKGFPFYGSLKLTSNNTINKINDNEAYVYPEVLIQLSTEIGKTIKLGTETFIIKGVISDDGQQSFQMNSIAPKIYISRDSLNKAGLIQKGSTVSYAYFFKTDFKFNSKQLKKIDALLDDTSIEVLTPKKSSQQVGRILKYLNDFLGLVSLSGLFLATMGLMYLFRSFLFKRRKEISISQFLGLSNSSIILIYSGQLFVMSLIGSLLSVIVTPIFLPSLLNRFNTLLGMNLSFGFSVESIIAPFVIGTLGATLLGIPLIVPYTKSHHRSLFSHEDNSISTNSKWYYFLPGIIFFYLTSIYLSKSFLIGSLFTGVLGLSIFLIFVLGSILLSKMHVLSRKGALENKLAWGFVTRFKSSTLFIFSTLMISSMMITLIPQIKDVLLNEVERPLKENGPTAFLFDIQPEQVKGVENFLLKEDQSVLAMSPMIRSRLMKINSLKVQTSVKENMTREEERAVRMRNRGVNLSYRDELDSSEELVSGTWPKSTYNFSDNPVAKVTLEKRYAKRLGVSVGDTLEFDILGIPVSTEIVGLREVQWTSFRPNFFILFEKGVLEDAPKTYLSAIRGKDINQDTTFQTKLFKKYPNVSYVDIRRAINKITNIMNSMSLILRAMSLLVFFVGFLVLFSIITHQISLRRMNINLLKVLGLSKERLNRIIRLEFFYVSFSATFLGVSLSSLTCFLLSKFLFQGEFVINLATVLIPLVTIPLLSMIIAYLGTTKVLNSSASEIFSEIN
jgi:putative ABC transport system permease protein